MTSEEQEALSRKYSNEVVMLLRLSSGSIAVFNAARELVSICRSDDLRVHVEAVKPPVTRPVGRQQYHAPLPPEIDLGEIEL